MTGIRPPAVAGLFYPEGGDELTRTVDGLLLAADVAAIGRPKAIIAPHAGYLYSGPIAASAMASLRSAVDRITRVVVIGPSHRVAFRGLALPAASAFTTPLGRLELDLEGAAALARLPQVRIAAAPHAEEHGIEVELPFLQRLLGKFMLLPLVVGEATGEEVTQALDAVWGGDETLVVVSSDLSHYLDDETARRRDRQTVERLLALRPDLQSHEACGAVAINGILPLARRHGLEPELLDLRSSGDTAGGRDRVVGYCAVAFHAKAKGEAPP